MVPHVDKDMALLIPSYFSVIFSDNKSQGN